MRVLLIGSGGREHALYWKIRQSPQLEYIRVLPGNGGIPESDRIGSLDWCDFSRLKEHVQNQLYDLVVVGPEDPLVAGIVDELDTVCPVFGPSKAAARLEGSKEYSKQFMQKYQIPSAKYESFTQFEQAWEYLQQLPGPYVIKTDGLAAGKGVAIASDLDQARLALQERMVDQKFGEAGQKVVIEEFMPGAEASVFALCDGRRAIPFMASQDHKRAFDNDQGPNTGGMGAYLPVPFMTDSILQQVQTEVLDRVMAGMQAEGHPYRGLLYAGLMVHQNSARVVEFNIRFGDPETQALMPMVQDDILPLLHRCAKGDLEGISSIQHKAGAAIVVVLASQGYPGEYQKNIALKDIDSLEGDIIPFHAGTARQGTQLVSTGGRVIGLSLQGSDLMDVRQRLYSQIHNYTSDGLFFRKDIGARGL